jgi:hypothetical protein
MSGHASRLAWLKAHGFEADHRSVELDEIGNAIWIDGHKGKRMVSLWLSTRDGRAIIHGITDPALTWEQVQDWIDPKPEPEKEPVKVQKSFFED